MLLSARCECHLPPCLFYFCLFCIPHLFLGFPSSGGLVRLPPSCRGKRMPHRWSCCGSCSCSVRFRRRPGSTVRKGITNVSRRYTTYTSRYPTPPGNSVSKQPFPPPPPYTTLFSPPVPRCSQLHQLRVLSRTLNYCSVAMDGFRGREYPWESRPFRLLRPFQHLIEDDLIACMERATVGASASVVVVPRFFWAAPDSRPREGTCTSFPRRRRGCSVRGQGGHEAGALSQTSVILMHACSGWVKHSRSV